MKRAAGSSQVLALRALGLAFVVVLASCSGSSDATMPEVSESDDSAEPLTADAPRVGDEPGVQVPESDWWFDSNTPTHVLATQGPVEESAAYIAVTWTHAVSSAEAYEVERDGEVVGTVEVDDQSWDDAIWHDTDPAATTATYRVRAVVAGQPGPWSDPVESTTLKSDGYGAVFEVDSFQGSDHRKASEAVRRASDAGGGVVLFGPRVYNFDKPLVISSNTNNVLLRGAGQGKTTLRADFVGGDNSCGASGSVVVFAARREPMGPTLTRDTPAGSRTLEFDRSINLSPGDVIQVQRIEGQLSGRQFAELGIAQDPTIPNDRRYPFDTGRVVSVQGNTVEIDHDLTQGLIAGSDLFHYQGGIGNGLELMSVEGPSEDETSFYQLIKVVKQVDFRIAEVDARWANRNMIDASGHNLTLIGFTGIEGGAGGYELEPCKYKIGFSPATDLTIVSVEMGSPDHDRNMSHLTIQFVYRAVIRNSNFHLSRTYGFNEHGGGSRAVVFENNRVAAGPSGRAGVFLGNDTWGFGGETTIRNNEFSGNVSDVIMTEHPYGISIVANSSTGCIEACIRWSGWGGEHSGYSPIEDPDRYGSARLLVADNKMVDAKAGLDLGARDSKLFGWEGIKDVVVLGNEIVSSDPGLTIVGSNDQSRRIWVANNDLGEMDTESPGDDWWLWANEGGRDAQSDGGPAAQLPDWADPERGWG